jgi:NAD(P)-dependent dehydrogenase (short-subunit alcohol dehydrogenase family)
MTSCWPASTRALIASMIAPAGSDRLGPRAIVVTKLDRERADFDETVAVCQRVFTGGGGVLPLILPIHGEGQDIVGFIDKTIKEFGQLDIAVNNAGVNKNSAAEETTLQEWDLQHNLNLRAVFRSCQLQAQHMLPRGYGKIINTASMASLIVPHPQKQVAYNTSKAGVVALTKTLAAEWADRGVRVNCMSPGIIRTALIEQSKELAPLVNEWVASIPAGRLGEVSDLQGGIVYLASSASDYMTGHNLVIEGGQTLW